MALTPLELNQILVARGLRFETTAHAPLFTVAESQALRGKLEGGHTKNLFVKDKKSQYFLLTMEENAEVDLKTIHTRIGASGRVSFGKPDAMFEMLGVTPGAVTLFGALNDKAGAVRVFIDEALTDFDKINAHPLTNEATITIFTQDMIALLTDYDHAPTILPRI